jgi:hypothetical protein
MPKHGRTNVILFLGGGIIYLQYLENTKLLIYQWKFIVIYFRYVNDILVVYHVITTNIHEVSNSFKGMTPWMQFSMQEESENNIIFSDIAIKNKKII